MKQLRHSNILTTQEQWDRHVRERSGRRILWRSFKTGLVGIVICTVLVLAAAPLAFG